jgi:hypothetical protein
VSKLLQLKNWLTLPEASIFISNAIGEPLTDADVLRFALDGRLQLSVNLVNNVPVRHGKVVAIGHGARTKLPDLERSPIRLYQGPRIYADKDGDHILELGKTICHAHGIYDLPLFGGERIDVEREFMRLTDGPERTGVSADGVFVDAGKGLICQILQDSEELADLIGSRAWYERAENSLSLDDYASGRSSSLLKRITKERSEFLANRRLREPHLHYRPASSLPSDTVFVVRTAEIDQLVR